MPYSNDNPPAVAKNWTDEEKAKCVTAANAVLADGKTEEDAIFACIHAAGRSSMSVANVGETIVGTLKKFARAFDVEIFAVGKWNGMEFARADLESIAASFKKLKALHKVPLKLGHNAQQPLTDGLPAIGWVDDVWVDGSKLFGRFIDVPQIVKDAIDKKLYRRVSIELDFNVSHMGSKYDVILSGVALLGADLPAVNTLADLNTYLVGDRLAASRRASFSATDDTTNQEGMTMDEAQVKKLIADATAPMLAQIAEKDKQIQQLTTDRANFAASQKAAEIVAKRATFTTMLETAVKEARITPAQREQFTKLFKVDSDDVLSSDLAQLDGMLKTMKTENFGRNTGNGGSAQQGGGSGRVHEDAGEELTRLAKLEIDRVPTINFARALEIVQTKNPELAREYVGGVDNG